MKFDASFFESIPFTPCVHTTSLQGAVRQTYPGPSSMVLASVQPRTIERVDESGRLLSVTRYEVFMREDPSPLNSGLGVRQEDSFLWRGITLVAQGDVVRECGPDGLLPVWRVECVARR